MRRTACYIILVLLLTKVCLETHAQDLNASGKLVLFTDRGIYIPGEEIYFSASVSKDEEESVLVNRIFYLELISSEGTSFSRGKYLIEDATASGRLLIPKGLISGVYYLKAYTRSARRTGPESFFYLPVKIVAPASSKILKPVKSNRSVAEKASCTNHSGIKITTDKAVYSKGEQVNLEFDVPEDLKNKLCITVIPAEALPLEPVHPPVQSLAKNDDKSLLPLSSGLIISGKLTDEKGKGIISEAVNLSIPSEKDFISVFTDSSANFCFRLPQYYGKKDIFLSTEKAGVQKEILVNNDYSPATADLPDMMFSLDSAESASALKMAQNYQLKENFYTKGNTNADSSSAHLPPFYGNPSEVLDIDKYIDLPTLEDFFIELILPAGIQKVNNRKSLHFFSTNPDMILNRPLVLIDWIAIDDDQKILALDPRKIDRIEFVNAPYVKGVRLYGGIISVISKEGDFGGIDLPSSGIFLNYDFLNHDADELVQEPEQKNLPDVRNNLFWKDRIRPDKSKLSFHTGNMAGTFLILLRTTDEEGTILCGSSSFEVK